MIDSIELNGFKSFVSEIIDLNGLTLLTGLNSSGKSSVIQSILLLEKGYRKEKIAIEGHGSLRGLKNSYSPNLEIQANFTNSTSISIVDDHVNVIGDVEFPEIIYISADRFGPETSMPIYIDSSRIGSKGQNIFNCIEINADKEINPKLKHENSEGDTFLFNLRAWLGVIAPNVQFLHKIEEITDSSFGTFNGHRSKNVGFGLSYTLPIITALLLGSVTPNCIVMLENPEAHLHPRGQTEIGRLISLCVECGVQVIVETHSDHLFDSIRVQAKLEDNFFEKVNIYWFQLDKNNNTDSQFSTLDNTGRLDSWPLGLFDQFHINASKLL